MHPTAALPRLQHWSAKAWHRPWGALVLGSLAGHTLQDSGSLRSRSFCLGRSVLYRWAIGSLSWAWGGAGQRRTLACGCPQEPVLSSWPWGPRSAGLEPVGGGCLCTCQVVLSSRWQCCQVGGEGHPTSSPSHPSAVPGLRARLSAVRAALALGVRADCGGVAVGAWDPAPSQDPRGEPHQGGVSHPGAGVCLWAVHTGSPQ